MNKIISLWLGVLLLACGGNNEPAQETVAPKLTSSTPVNNAVDIESGISEIKLIFDRQIKINDITGIKLNGESVNGVSVSVNTLIINTVLKSGTSYQLVVPKNAVASAENVILKEDITISFSTKASAVYTTELITPNSSVQAQKVFRFLKDNYEKKIVSGTMANVAWNVNEAEWVHSHTGKYPALNCFDFIHHPFSSPSSWIDYSNTLVVEDWWNNNGLVAAMWHWNVPKDISVSNPSEFAFYTKDTSFDVSKISDPNSPEYKLMLKDIDIISGYLKLLQQKNIPVIWRPLHEAAGAWFWWGAKGAGPCKALWKLMFDRMTNYHKLNNLIWVWTSENNDPDWYPGDAYVDIIGRDLYNKNGTEALREFNKLKTDYPNKMIALSECGAVPAINLQWTSGATWSWFMPWYDYQRTNDPQEADFSETTHQHADITWWKAAFAADYVISRDKMPSLK